MILFCNMKVFAVSSTSINSSCNQWNTLAVAAVADAVIVTDVVP